jgi:hypothetical protein
MREKYIPPPKNGVQKYYFDLKYNTNSIFFSKNLKLKCIKGNCFGSDSPQTE